MENDTGAKSFLLRRLTLPNDGCRTERSSAHACAVPYNGGVTSDFSLSLPAQAAKDYGCAQHTAYATHAVACVQSHQHHVRMHA